MAEVFYKTRCFLTAPLMGAVFISYEGQQAGYSLAR